MPAGNTYEAIATQTLGSSATSVTFSSIPSTYTDLVIVTSIQGDAPQNANIRFNNDSGTNYSDTYFEGDGSTASSGRRSNQTSIVDGGYYQTASNTFSVGLIHINNYSNTTTYKTALFRSNRSTSLQAVVGLWRSTAAINRIDIIAGSGNFLTGSTFSIYGILAA